MEQRMSQYPAGLDRIQYRGQSSADVARALRKAKEECFTSDRADAPNVAVLVTPGILSGDISTAQYYAREVCNRPNK